MNQTSPHLLLLFTSDYDRTYHKYHPPRNNRIVLRNNRTVRRTHHRIDYFRLIVVSTVLWFAPSPLPVVNVDSPLTIRCFCKFSTISGPVTFHSFSTNPLIWRIIPLFESSPKSHLHCDWELRAIRSLLRSRAVLVVLSCGCFDHWLSGAAILTPAANKFLDREPCLR